MADITKQIQVNPKILESCKYQVDVPLGDELFACLDIQSDVRIVGIGAYISSTGGTIIRKVIFDFQPLRFEDVSSSNSMSVFAYTIDSSVSEDSIYLEEDGRVLPRGTRILYYVNPQSDNVTASITLLVEPV